MDVLLWMRLANVALATICLVYLMLDFRVVRHDLNSRRIYLTFSLAGLFLAVIVGSVTHIYQDAPFGFQVPIFMASCFWCLIGLWLSRHDRPSLWKDFPK